MAETYTSLLNTAGLSPNQYGLQVAIDAANRSVMQNLVMAYAIDKGSTLYIPKVGERTVSAITRGSTEADSDITFEALDDTAASFTKRFAYNGLEVTYATLNDMPPAHLRAWLEAERVQIAAALANDVDSKLLNLYSSASDSVGSSAENATWAMIKEAIKKLRVANAPEPYYIVLPETQWDHLAGIDELVRQDIRGEGLSIQDRQQFYAFGVRIFTTGNVPTASGAAHGLAFSREGIALAFRDQVAIKEFDYPTRFAHRMAAYSDYIYANTFDDYIVDFVTTDD